MEAFSKPRTWIIVGVVLAGLFLLYQLWHWEVERVTVPPDHFLVVINRWGKDLPEGAIVAPDSSYKGIQRKVEGEGMHFYNPIFYGYDIHKTTEVKEGEFLVLTRVAGAEIPRERLEQGEFLARGKFKDRKDSKDAEADNEPIERGILPDVVRQGKWRINPYEYTVEPCKSTKIGTNQVGVHTLKWGKVPPLPEAGASKYVVPGGCRGVQQKYKPAGDYYMNPYVEALLPVDTLEHQVTFSDIEFYSRDGFLLKPHILVVYKVIPEKAPELFVMLSTKGILHQDTATEADKQKNEILQKFVLPLIRGYVRIEGSKFPARDYISMQTDPGAVKTNPRKHLEEVLTTKVKPECEKIGVKIQSIAVGVLEQQGDLAKMAAAIAIRPTTRNERAKNEQLVKQYAQDKEKMSKGALADRAKSLVEADTKLAVEKTRAEQATEVEKGKLEAELAAAQTKLEAARSEAEQITTLGKSQTSVIMANNKAEVAELKTAVAGFPTPEIYAQYQVIKRLSPALSEIFASDTSEFARLFNTYMTPAKKSPGVTVAPGAPGSTPATEGTARRDK